MSRDDKVLKQIHTLGHEFWKKYPGWKTKKSQMLPKSEKKNEFVWKEYVEKWVDLDLVKKIVIAVVKSILEEQQQEYNEASIKKIINERDEEIFLNLQENLIDAATKKSFSKNFSFFTDDTEELKKCFRDFFDKFYFDKETRKLNYFYQEINIKQKGIKIEAEDLLILKSDIKEIAHYQIKKHLLSKGIIKESNGIYTKIQNKEKLTSKSQIFFPHDIKELQKNPIFMTKYNHPIVKKFDTLINPILNKIVDALIKNVCDKIIPAYEKEKSINKDFLTRVFIFDEIKDDFDELLIFKKKEFQINVEELIKKSVFYLSKNKNRENIIFLSKYVDTGDFFKEACDIFIDNLFERRNQEESLGIELQRFDEFNPPETDTDESKASGSQEDEEVEQQEMKLVKTVIPNYYCFETNNITELFFAFKATERTLIRLYKYLASEYFLHPFLTQDELCTHRHSMGYDISNENKQFLETKLAATLKPKKILFTFYYQFSNVGRTSIEYTLQKKSGVIDLQMSVLGSYENLNKRIFQSFSYFHCLEDAKDKIFVKYILNLLKNPRDENINKETKITPGMLTSFNQFVSETAICLLMVEGFRNKSVLVLYPLILLSIYLGRQTFTDSLKKPTTEKPFFYMCPVGAAQPGKQLDVKYSETQKLLASSRKVSVTEIKEIKNAELSIINSMPPALKENFKKSANLSQFIQSFWKNPINCFQKAEKDLNSTKKCPGKT